MEFSVQAMLLLPAGLGLLGFIEPCTIGGHLIFLNSQTGRTPAQKIRPLLAFTAARSLMAGLFGALISWLGGFLITMQTGLWLIFGFLYLTVGLAFLAGRLSAPARGINPAPKSWKLSKNPLVLGLGFGLSIPACAAPILFALLGVSATMGSLSAGFLMMFVFGLFLSFPLLILILFPAISAPLGKLGEKLFRSGWLAGIAFLALGLWSVWFALYVNPADWAGQ